MANSAGSPDAIAVAREREKRLRSITRTAPDAIVVIDESGIIDTVNPAAERLFGYSRAELVGQNVKVLMPSPHREAHDSHLARYRETGEKRVIGIGRVVVGRRKDGTTFPARLAIGEIELEHGRLFTGFLHDITERENIQRRAGILQQELMHASRLSAMGEMASGIAHELNQPLTAVMNYTKAARRRLDRAESGAEPIADLVDKAGQQAERAAEIVKRLRRFIKKDESERRLEPVNAVVEEAAALALIGASDRDIELIFSLNDALPPVLMDRIEVQQVVLNILRNAIEAFEGTGDRKIYISTQAAGSRKVQVNIRDNGPGLAPSIADDPFRPFQTTKADGMGIGLAISRTIIDAHGGRLWAESPPGGGAVFRFSLPAGSASDG
ncbi:MAG: PAS domain S-box protein [Rhodospirillales bacterium]|nr:PAS domain S-box protein [Rhodospirillales bacterium]